MSQILAEAEFFLSVPSLPFISTYSYFKQCCRLCFGATELKIR